METIQLHLQRVEGHATVETTCWVPYDKKAKRVKLGTQLSLKGETERWTVIGMSEVTQGKPNRGWDNNI